MANDIFNSNTFNSSTVNANGAESSDTPHPPRWVKREHIRRRYQLRTFPWLIIIGALLGAAALLLGFTEPAYAGEPLLVSNTEQSDDDYITLMGSNGGVAQGFTTGSTGGYGLGSIKIHLHSVPNSISGVGVRLRSSTAMGVPSSELCTLTLTNPSNLGPGIQKFGAANNCPTLTANTLYFVSMNYINPNNAYTFRLTSSGGEDSGSLSGWEISNAYYSDSGGGWGEVSGEAIRIQVLAPNTPPTAAPQTVTTDEDEEFGFSVTDFGFDDTLDTVVDTLNHVKITSLPNQGMLKFNGNEIIDVSTPPQVMKADLKAGNLTYTPLANAYGNPNPYTSFNFKVNDGFDDSASAYRMTIDVNAVNDPPVATLDNTSTVAEDASLIIDVIRNATDVDGDTLSVAAVGTAKNGTVAIVSGSTRDVEYTPNADFYGRDSFTYTVSDGNGGTATGKVTVTVTGVPDAPVAAPIPMFVFEYTVYTFGVADFGFMDVDDDTLHHVKITSLPNQGMLSLDGSDITSTPKTVTATELSQGKLTYTPPDVEDSRTVPATFNFKVNDGSVDSTEYIFTVKVVPVLSVGFGAAAYEADEGGEVEVVEVKLSQQAVVALEIPIIVTPRGETVAADYEVLDLAASTYKGVAVAGTLTFAAGEDTKTFRITANEDEDFHDETVILSFGTLPDGAEAEKDAPVQATLTIIDDEGAEIRGRFPRLNAEILSKHALTIADVTNRVISERMDDPCGEKAAAYTLAGGSTIHDTLQSNVQAINDGTLTLDDALAGSSLLLPLRAANDKMADRPGGPVLWGQGNRHRIESRDSAFAWDGTVLTGQVGIDGCPRKDILTGMMLSRSTGEFDYTDETGQVPVSGDYEHRMTSAHPYLGWSSPLGLGLWATVGYGKGEIKIVDSQAGRQDSDTTLKTVAMGASGPLMTDGSLIAGGTTTLTLRSEASWAQVEVEGNNDLLEKQTVNARRLRLALEGSHEQALVSGGSLTPSLELGLRHDGGDGATGSGFEIGGSLRYRNPTGLTIEGRGRVLRGQSDYREWGIGGSLHFDPHAGGRGLSFRLTPTLGATESGVARLWDQDVAALTANDRETNDNAPQMRLDSELGYGLSALGGDGLLTPYGGFSLAGEGSQSYRLGSRFEIGSAFNLSLEGERRETASDDAAEHGVMLRGQLWF